MPRTFDAGDFDIHEFEKDKPEILPVTKKEKIDNRVLKVKSKAKPEKKSHSKLIFIGVVANVLLPGLGNVLLKKSRVSGTLLILNLILLVTTLAPLSVLGLIGNVVYPQMPAVFTTETIIDVWGPTKEIALAPEAYPLIVLVIAAALVAWAHFVYLALQERKR